MVWSPPGSPAPKDRWRYDLGKKSFTPPGLSSPTHGAQVVMPEDFNRANKHGFHLLTSPAGNQAPIDHINYTPETGEIHGRGQAAPADKLNYSLIPESALTGSGHTSAGGLGTGMSGGGGAGHMSNFDQPLGYGAGAAAPMPQQRQPFAGTPPLGGAPNMTGPSPTLNRAMPQWGGATSMSQRMGMGTSMGAGDEFDNSDPTQSSTPSDNSTTVTETSGNSTTSSSDTAGQGYPAGSNLQGGQSSTASSSSSSGQRAGPPDSNKPAITQPAFDGSGRHLGDYVIHPPTTLGGNATVTWVPDPKNTARTPPPPSTQKLDDGSVVTITPNPSDPEHPTVTTDVKPSPEKVREAVANADLAEANAKIAQQKLALANATSATDKAKAQVDLQNLQADLLAKQDAHEKAVADLQKANRPGSDSAQHPDKPGPNGNIWTWDPSKGTYVDTNFKPGEDAKDWTQPFTMADGSTAMYNATTKELRVISPPDPNARYDKPIHMGADWKVWNPQTKSYDVVGHDGPNTENHWQDNKLYTTVTDPSTGKATTTVQTFDPTQSQQDAHMASIDNHNQAVENIAKTRQDLQNGRISMAQARITLEKDMQNLINPQPYEVGHMIFAPPGYSGSLQTYNPQTKQFGSEPLQGPPQDPSVKQTIDSIRSQLSDMNYGNTETGGQTQTQATTPPADTGHHAPAPAQAQAAPPTDSRTTGVAPSTEDQSFKTGWPGSDPRLSGGTQPPTKRTTAAGDIASYDAGGQLTGIDYINTAPPNYGQPGYPGSEDLKPEDFKTYDNSTDEGTGNMGSGASGTPGGWVPRPAPFSRATGPGWIGGSMGTGQAAPTTLPPLPLPQGHQPGQDVLPTPPGVFTPPMQPKPNVNTGPGSNAQGQTTDKGSNWTPNIIDLVKQQVHQSLRELLGMPELGSPEHDLSGDPSLGEGYRGQQGLQGGHSLPETGLVDPQTHEIEGEPTSDTPLEPGTKRFESMGPGQNPVTEPEDLQDTPPMTQQQIDQIRQEYNTLGTGQAAPTPPTDTATQPQGRNGPIPDPRQLLQSMQAGPGKQTVPKWMRILLRRHPELLQMAQGGQQPGMPTSPTGGPTGGPPSAPPPAAAGPMGAATPAPMGGGQDQPPAGPGVPPPQAPGPGGAPMQPPLPPQDVAGIGHRFGQQMDVGEPQHSGVDLQAPEGTPTQSPVDGFVADVSHDPNGLGLTVVIQGKDGSQHKLGHLSATKAYRGMQVARGQDLGSAVGSTGLSTGAHLHWGVKDQQGQPVDPTAALGPMAQMPPVPGTEQMGPPGGTGAPGGPTPQDMGGGQSNGDLKDTQPYDPVWKNWPSLSKQAAEGGSRAGGQGTGPDWTRMTPEHISPDSLGTGQAKANPPIPGWNPKKPRAKRRWGKPNPMGQGHMSNARNPKGFGVGQSGAPTNYQSPDYQQGYQDGMQASASPGRPPLFTPGMAQPIPGAQDMSQGFGGQQQGGGQ